jgi:hypothetical protein
LFRFKFSRGVHGGQDSPRDARSRGSELMGLLMTAMAGLPYRHRWNMDVISGGRVRPVPWPGAPSPILGSARIGDQTAAGP